MPPAVRAAGGRTTPSDSDDELGNLHHITDLGVKRGRRATRSVQSLGTTAKLPSGFGNPEWSADLEYVFRIRTADELARLHGRAGVQRRAARAAATPYDRVAYSRSAEWHEHRARALSMPRAQIVNLCGKRWRKVECGCGVQDVPVGCDQTQLCETCRRTHWRRWRKRITRAMDAHLEGARRAWCGPDRRGMRPGVYLVTFTMPHSGDVVLDRGRMYTAWRAITKIASARSWWGHFALTWEVTPGTRGDGHVHLHVAAISSWIPYDELREAWAAAMPGSIQPDVSAPKRSSKPAQSAADYLAKYVTKGVDPAVFTGQKAGELLVAFRGQRKVSTSIGFWVPIRDRDTACKVCGSLHRCLGAPSGLASVAPGSQLYPRGWWAVGRRRDEQCMLQADTG